MLTPIKNKLNDLLEILNSTTENAADKFNTWELGFLEGMSERVDEYNLEDLYITDLQEDKIDEIWRKYCE